jgi:hypothetical protein
LFPYSLVTDFGTGYGSHTYRLTLVWASGITGIVFREGYTSTSPYVVMTWYNIKLLLYNM